MGRSGSSSSSYSAQEPRLEPLGIDRAFFAEVEGVLAEGGDAAGVTAEGCHRRRINDRVGESRTLC